MEARSYLGFTCYYRRFKWYYAKIVRPLIDLLVGHCTSKKNRNKRSKSALFAWTERQQISYDTLKKKLIKQPVLAYTDYSKPYKIHMDASTTGLGAVLYQNRDGMDRVVANTSRSL